MSTKTTFKRVALVAVAALGFGTLSTVSANAATVLSTISVGTVPAARPGAAVIIPITINVSSHGAGETITTAAKIISAPTSGGVANGASVLGTTTGTTQATGGTYTSATNVLFWADSDGTFAGTDANAVYGATSGGNVTDDVSYIGTFVPGTTTAGNIAAATAGGVAASAQQSVLNANANTATSVTRYLVVRPDIAGTYSVLVSATAGATAAFGNLSYVAGDLSTTITFTTKGAPTTATLTNIGGSTNPRADGYGALVKVTLADSAGVATSLAGDEVVNVAVSAGNISKATISAGNFTSVDPDTAALTTVGLGASDFINGMAFVNVKDSNSTAASSMVLTTSAGGALIGTISGTLTVTSVKTPSITATLVTSTTAAGAAVTASDYAGTNRTAANAVAIPATATSATFEFGISAATASATSFIQIEDIKGTITGAPGTANSLYFDKAMTNGSAGTSTEVTSGLTFRNAPLAALANAFTIQDVNTASIGSNTETISFVASATTLGSLTVSPDALRMATGGAATFTATYNDQFAVAKANISVTVTVSGRNSAKTAATLITDADGRVSYSFTDTGTTGTADVITFTAGGTSVDYVNITYGVAVAGSVMVDTPSTDGFTATTAGLDTYPVAYSYIDASSYAGTESGAVAISALVKDADGNVMAAMPVTWTVSGTGCAIPTNMVTSYTDASGVATSELYAWIQGACVVTATSGGKSDTANSYWVQDGAAEARTISATVVGNSVVALVQDRFGNPISAVDVKITRVSGEGYFGSASSATAGTGTDGKVTFVVTGGSVVATVGFTTTTFGQSDAAVGLVDGTSTAATNTFTASVAGTVLDAESGVGATLSAAGVNSVSVSVDVADQVAAAADAAAEATDAANAATDAANAAAQAAAMSVWARQPETAFRFLWPKKNSEPLKVVYGTVPLAC
jgi:hypothetical protein